MNKRSWAIAFVSAVLVLIAVLAYREIWSPIPGKGVPSASHPDQQTVPIPASDLARAAADMVLPPPGTPLAISGTDPRRLRAAFETGRRTYHDGDSELVQQQGASLIHTAAALGYRPARIFVAREFVRSRPIRMVASVQDATRYAIDDFVADGSDQALSNFPLVTLGKYLGARKELTSFATHLIEAIRDDQRLQVSTRLERMIKSLAGIEGMCMAIARAFPEGRRANESECSDRLTHSLARYVRSAGSPGHDDASRRRALSTLGHIP